MSKLKVHINCDMGESFGRYTLVDDKALMGYIDACNIACGYHAGDALVMEQTIKNALEQGIEIGAHPSYPDRQGFGRRAMDITEVELEAMLKYQISAIQGMVTSQKGELHHVKVHGALYNKASIHEPSAQAVVNAVASISQDLLLYAPYKSLMSEIGIATGLTVYHEAFIDRRYNSNRSLVSRKMEGAVIEDPRIAFRQVQMIATSNNAKSSSGELFHIEAKTFCIHGDNPAAIKILKHIRSETS